MVHHADERPEHSNCLSCWKAICVSVIQWFETSHDEVSTQQQQVNQLASCCVLLVVTFLVPWKQTICKTASNPCRPQFHVDLKSTLAASDQHQPKFHASQNFISKMTLRVDERWREVFCCVSSFQNEIWTLWQHMRLFKAAVFVKTRKLSICLRWLIQVSMCRLMSKSCVMCKSCARTCILLFMNAWNITLNIKEWLIHSKLLELFLRSALWKQKEINFSVGPDIAYTWTPARQKLHMAKCEHDEINAWRCAACRAFRVVKRRKLWKKPKAMLKMCLIKDPQGCVWSCLTLHPLQLPQAILLLWQEFTRLEIAWCWESALLLSCGRWMSQVSDWGHLHPCLWAPQCCSFLLRTQLPFNKWLESLWQNRAKKWWQNHTSTLGWVDHNDNENTETLMIIWGIMDWCKSQQTPGGSKMRCQFAKKPQGSSFVAKDDNDMAGTSSCKTICRIGIACNLIFAMLQHSWQCQIGIGATCKCGGCATVNGQWSHDNIDSKLKIQFFHILLKVFSRATSN